MEISLVKKPQSTITHAPSRRAPPPPVSLNDSNSIKHAPSTNQMADKLEIWVKLDSMFDPVPIETTSSTTFQNFKKYILQFPEFQKYFSEIEKSNLHFVIQDSSTKNEKFTSVELSAKIGDFSWEGDKTLLVKKN